MNISSKFKIEKAALDEFAKATENANQTVNKITLSQKESSDTTRTTGVSTKQK